MEQYTETPNVQYTVPERGAPIGSNPTQPPQPRPGNALVLHFSEAGASIPNAKVTNYAGAVRYQFKSDGIGHMEMYGQDGTVVGKVDNGRIFMNDSDGKKMKDFFQRDMPGSTFPIITLNGQRYEWVQEMFYAIVRSTPASERMAIIYNFSGNPAVEMLPEGAAVAGLEELVVFVTAANESGILKKQSKISKALRNITRRQKS